MSAPKAPSIRARVRAEMTDEIKRVALEHLARDGSALSLRAVARDMGMVSSAIYRYFPSRDDLLTTLIVDAYNSLGEFAEFADDDAARRDAHLSRWFAVGHAIRKWAVAKPAEYALIYGSPIPGYKAPQDTVEPANRAILALARSVAEAERAGKISPPATPDAYPPSENAAFTAEMRNAADFVGLTPETAERFFAAVTHLFGAVSFELFGRLNNVIDQRAEWFDRQLRAMAASIGFSPLR